MNIPLICSLILYACYITLKYSAYISHFSQRPTWKELNKYDFENIKKRRNAKALLWLSIFFLCIWILFLVSPSPIRINSFRNEAIVCLKLIFLASIGFNLMARYVVYQEKTNVNKKNLLPIFEIIEVVKRTPWMMLETDIISVTITVTTAASLTSLSGLLYFMFNQ